MTSSEVPSSFERETGLVDVACVPRGVPPWLIPGDLLVVPLLIPMGLLCWLFRVGFVIVVTRRRRWYSLPQVVGYEYFPRSVDTDAREAELREGAATGAFDLALSIGWRQRCAIVREAKVLRIN